MGVGSAFRPITAAVTSFDSGGGSLRPPAPLVTVGEPWQTEAWDLFDAVGELHFAGTWVSNVCSTARLYPVEHTATGDVPITKPGHEAMVAMGSFFGSAEGRREATRLAILNRFIAGEYFIIWRGWKDGKDVGTPPPSRELWEVLSVIEAKSSGNGWQIQINDQWVPLASDEMVHRVWNAHPRKRSKADSGVKAALPVLRRIVRAGEHQDVQLESRLLGTGMLMFSDRVRFGSDGTMGTGDAFVKELLKHMATQKNRGTAGTVPLTMTVPDEALKNGGATKLDFWSTVDEKVITIETNALRRLAVAVDLPPELLLGTAEMNRWGQWQVEEASVKATLEPLLQGVADAFAHAALHSRGVDTRFGFAYDTTQMRLRPNRTREAIVLYQMGVLSGDALLKETGFDLGQKLEGEEYTKWLMMKWATGSTTPGMIAFAARELGLDVSEEEIASFVAQTSKERPGATVKDIQKRELPNDGNTPVNGY